MEIMSSEKISVDRLIFLDASKIISISLLLNREFSADKFQDVNRNSDVLSHRALGKQQNI